MLRNSLRRVLPALAVVALSVTLMGCPPAQTGSRDDGPSGSNDSEEPETPPEDEKPEEEEANAGADDSAQTGSQEPREMGIVSSTFGSMEDGTEVTEWTITNANGVRLQLMDYGASILSVEVPDRDGNFDNVTLAFNSFEGFEGAHPYFGSTVGRYANRIALGKFSIDGTEYELATNNGVNHLHGGNVGFNHVMWSGEQFEDDTTYGVKFTYVSPDGEEGYPGELTCTATYALSKKADEVTITFDATTDAPTVVNLANHSYWNLSGNSHDDNTILDQHLQILADQYLPVDDTLIPTGELKDVEGTVFDFREPKPIGQDIEELRGDVEGSSNPGCYDHNWVLEGPYDEGESKLRAVLYDPETGRKMEMYSEEPGVQFYTGNFLSGKDDDAGYHQHAGLCLEFQHWPDSPNQPDFPSTRLNPGENYHTETIHLFSVE